MLRGAATEALTSQLGNPGSWDRRLPHVPMDFTPSRGEELQSEYLEPREHAIEAIERLRGIRDRLTPLLQVTCRSRRSKPSRGTSSGSRALTARTSSGCTSPGCATYRL